MELPVNLPTSMRRLALASALALACSQAAASIRMSEAFEGAWFNPAQAGRGVLIDWIPNTQRAGGTLFATVFVFDNAGNPIWLSLQENWSEFQFTSSSVGIFRASAGTWNTPAALNNQRIGSATVTLNTCRSITISVDMDAATGLADQTFSLRRLAGGQDEDDCVYNEPFAGCPNFATAAPASFGQRACLLPPTLTGDRILRNNITWVVQGKVQLGRDMGSPGGVDADVDIEPGTLFVTSGQANAFDYLVVNRGSEIYAEGTREFPIIMTTANELPGAARAPAPGQVGGLVLLGGAPANCFPNCLPGWEPGAAASFGGPNTAAAREDGSGELTFVQVRYAGSGVPGRELSAFTFAGVGHDTELEHLQAFHGADDGFEWHGGTARLRNAVVTCPGDDGFAWSEGWTGKLQFAVVEMRGCAGSNHGFELSNSLVNPNAAPRSRGTVANVTVWGNSQLAASDAVHIHGGAAGHFHNLMLVGSPRSCVQIQGAETQAVARTPGLLTAQGWRTYCPVNASDGSGVAAGFTAGWFHAPGADNAVLSSNPLRPNSVLPNGEAPQADLPDGDEVPGFSDWFESADYVGAFESDRAEDNWMRGWARPFQP